MTPAAARTRRHVERCYETVEMLERFLRELRAQRLRAAFTVIMGGKQSDTEGT